MSKNKTTFEVFISKSVSVQLWGDIPISLVWKWISDLEPNKITATPTIYCREENQSAWPYISYADNHRFKYSINMIGFDFQAICLNTVLSSFSSFTRLLYPIPQGLFSSSIVWDVMALLLSKIYSAPYWVSSPLPLPPELASCSAATSSFLP